MQRLKRSNVLLVASVTLASLFAISAFVSGQTKKLTAEQAKDHIGEQATVCGQVVSARYAASTRGNPTFLNLDKPYPSQLFTVVIWGENRAKFGEPERKYLNKTICVAGTITEYRSGPEIVVSGPGQVSVESK